MISGGRGEGRVESGEWRVERMTKDIDLIFGEKGE
jgi:hypothetical protein